MESVGSQISIGSRSERAFAKDRDSYSEVHLREREYCGNVLSGSSRPSSMHSDVKSYANTGIRRSFSTSTIGVDVASPSLQDRQQILPNLRIKRPASVDIAGAPGNPSIWENTTDAQSRRSPVSGNEDDQQPSKQTIVKRENLFRLTGNETLHQPDAYQWLLAGILQNERLSFRSPNAMIQIGDQIFGELQAGFNLRAPSQRPLYSLSTMVFGFACSLEDYRSRFGFDRDISVDGFVNKVLCLTGSRLEAQLLTASDYIH